MCIEYTDINRNSYIILSEYNTLYIHSPKYTYTYINILFIKNELQKYIFRRYINNKNIR